MDSVRSSVLESERDQPNWPKCGHVDVAGWEDLDNLNLRRVWQERVLFKDAYKRYFHRFMPAQVEAKMNAYEEQMAVLRRESSTGGPAPSESERCERTQNENQTEKLSEPAKDDSAEKQCNPVNDDVMDDEASEKSKKQKSANKKRKKSLQKEPEITTASLSIVPTSTSRQKQSARQSGRKNDQKIWKQPIQHDSGVEQDDVQYPDEVHTHDEPDAIPQSLQTVRVAKDASGVTDGEKELSMPSEMEQALNEWPVDVTDIEHDSSVNNQKPEDVAMTDAPLPSEEVSPVETSISSASSDDATTLLESKDDFRTSQQDRTKARPHAPKEPHVRRLFATSARSSTARRPRTREREPLVLFSDSRPSDQLSGELERSFTGLKSEATEAAKIIPPKTKSGHSTGHSAVVDQSRLILHQNNDEQDTPTRNSDREVSRHFETSPTPDFVNQSLMSSRRRSIKKYSAKSKRANAEINDVISASSPIVAQSRMVAVELPFQNGDNLGLPSSTAPAQLGVTSSVASTNSPNFKSGKLPRISKRNSHTSVVRDIQEQSQKRSLAREEERVDVQPTPVTHSITDETANNKDASSRSPSVETAELDQESTQHSTDDVEDNPMALEKLTTPLVQDLETRETNTVIVNQLAFAQKMMDEIAATEAEFRANSGYIQVVEPTHETDEESSDEDSDYDSSISHESTGVIRDRVFTEVEEDSADEGDHENGIEGQELEADIDDQPDQDDDHAEDESLAVGPLSPSEKDAPRDKNERNENERDENDQDNSDQDNSDQDVNPSVLTEMDDAKPALKQSVPDDAKAEVDQELGDNSNEDSDSNSDSDSEISSDSSESDNSHVLNDTGSFHSFSEEEEGEPENENQDDDEHEDSPVNMKEEVTEEISAKSSLESSAASSEDEEEGAFGIDSISEDSKQPLLTETAQPSTRWSSFLAPASTAPPKSNTQNLSDHETRHHPASQGTSTFDPKSTDQKPQSGFGFSLRGFLNRHTSIPTSFISRKEKVDVPAKKSLLMMNGNNEDEDDSSGSESD